MYLFNCIVQTYCFMTHHDIEFFYAQQKHCFNSSTLNLRNTKDL